MYYLFTMLFETDTRISKLLKVSPTETSRTYYFRVKQFIAKSNERKLNTLMEAPSVIISISFSILYRF